MTTVGGVNGSGPVEPQKPQAKEAEQKVDTRLSDALAGGAEQGSEVAEQDPIASRSLAQQAKDRGEYAVYCLTKGADVRPMSFERFLQDKYYNNGELALSHKDKLFKDSPEAAERREARLQAIKEDPMNNRTFFERLADGGEYVWYCVTKDADTKPMSYEHFVNDKYRDDGRLAEQHKDRLYK